MDDLGDDYYYSGDKDLGWWHHYLIIFTGLLIVAVVFYEFYKLDKDMITAQETRDLALSLKGDRFIEEIVEPKIKEAVREDKTECLVTFPDMNQPYIQPTIHKISNKGFRVSWINNYTIRINW